MYSYIKIYEKDNELHGRGQTSQVKIQIPSISMKKKTLLGTK